MVTVKMFLHKWGYRVRLVVIVVGNVSKLGKMLIPLFPT